MCSLTFSAISMPYYEPPYLFPSKDFPSTLQLSLGVPPTITENRNTIFHQAVSDTICFSKLIIFTLLLLEKHFIHVLYTHSVWIRFTTTHRRGIHVRIYTLPTHISHPDQHRAACIPIHMKRRNIHKEKQLPDSRWNEVRVQTKRRSVGQHTAERRSVWAGLWGCIAVQPWFSTSPVPMAFNWHLDWVLIKYNSSFL